MLKFIFLTILSAVIFFFVWNFLKRFFFNEQRPTQKGNLNRKPSEKKFNWDAETVEYEEVKEKK
ncbi:hypothetical protein [Bergeyella zoohelcum]|uniref:Uncharacterized protein n=1 Tax=Bergeyella zoohelcum ATCC 43767 TaxID=883096 RepID=K1LQ45_9FLAO|nr:hypothetical protein [Bergeyella zoohelcum]EKB56901.1 hypothetical protein HMPREF9699_01184 [Bergeyella zoohelcum ATCC 43767]MDY6024996.1 hypothetical protein [Bergeyella zoohelcum]SUV48635.1 Uncharacterised protein [Bergeyella zoohelcum]